MKTLSKIFSTLILGGVFFSNFSAAACVPGVDPDCQGPIAPTTPTTPQSNGNSDLVNSVFDGSNVVKQEGDVTLAGGKQNIFVRVGSVLLQIAVVLATAIIIYGGVMYAGSQGDEAKAKKAISIIIYAVYGLVLALASLIIVNLIQSGVNSTTQAGK